MFIYVVRRFSIEQAARVLQLISAAGTSLFPSDVEGAEGESGRARAYAQSMIITSALPDAFAMTGWGRCVRRSCLRCSNSGDEPRWARVTDDGTQGTRVVGAPRPCHRYRGAIEALQTTSLTAF
jgi:hypothetical protein